MIRLLLFSSVISLLPVAMACALASNKEPGVCVPLVQSGIADRWILLNDKAFSVVYTTKKIPHTGDTESLDICA